MELDRYLTDAPQLVCCGPRISCSEASCRSSGCKSHQRRGPATAVVISSGGEGDRTVGSLDVKVPDGWETGRIRTGGRANWQAVAKSANRGSPEMVPPREADLRDSRECRAADISAKVTSTSLLWNLSTFELPGVGRGWHVSTEWTAKARNHSRVA